ncbi:MAG: right-handed parallel beta-helix repeat-containing protein, partial [Candidatus Cloacimonetes bacterium]|nr:right-handed parallel beta-helix repeat-containing protein [Candidatus Cloacimonadota bacterium]
MNLKKFIIITIFIMLTAAGGLWADTFSVGSADFSEGFEVNEHSWNSYESVLEIVSSGTDGITSSGGDYHLKITDPATGDPGSYTWLGGTDYGFNLGWSSSIDIYINLSDSKIQTGEYGFHLSQSISDTDGSPYLQDNIWHVGAVDDGEGGYEVGVNTGHGTNGTPSNSVINPGNYHNVDYGVFNQSGWYTFHVAFTNGVEITWTISDENDNEVWTASEITENYQASEAGGNGYLWFTTIEADAMNIDNVEVVRETYDTIQAAIDDATSGDIIDVAAGDYDVATTINVNKSVTIDGTDSGTATVTAIDDAAIPIFEITVDNVTIKDLDITTTQATIDAYDSYDGLIQTPASGYTLTGLVIENNNIWSPLQGDQSTMGTWNARGIYIGRNTTATVEDNTVYNLRTGMVARYGCSVTYTNNLVYNTKGGIMNYTNSLDDDDDYTITGNSWTAPDPQYSHNQWDIVWNSGGSYSDPLPAGHYEHVVTNSENNNGAYVIDQRGPGTTKAVYGNRSHVFVEAGSGYNTAEDNVGNFLEPYATIDLGIGAVATGGIVNVAAGTYTEQLHITTEDLTIQGTATSDVIVKSPEDLTEFYNSGSNDNYPVVFVDGGDGCTLKNLTVDGDNQGDNNYRFQGIGYWNAGGTMQNLNVINVMNSTFSGAQHGVGVYCYNNDSGPYNLTVDNVDVTDFQKNAFALNGDNLTVTMSNCDVVGAGATDVTAQNGIQIWGNGSTGTITDCTVDGINYTPGDWTASAFLNYYAEVTLTNVTISNSETSFYNYYGSNINFNNCSTSNSVSTSFYNYGCDNIIYDNCSTTNPAGDAFYAWAVGSSKSSSIKEELSVPFGEGNNVKDKASDDITVEMDNCTFTGTGAADSWGIGLIADDNTTLDATIENCDISDWDTAIYTYGNEDPTQCTINSASHENDLSGNNYGFQNNTDITQDATCNYWGSPLGPDDPDNSPALNPFYTNPGDCGNAVSANVDFMPWYATETTSPATAKATLKSDVGSKAIIEVFTSDSLTSALENCTATDTIVLGSGTFTGDFEVGAGITMQAADGTTPVINGTLTIDSDDVSIDGVTLDASGTGSQAVVVSTGVDASTIEIQNGVILGDGASGKVAVLNNGTNDIGNLDGNWWGSSSPDFNDLIEPDPGSNPTPSSVAPISIYVSAPSEIISDDSTQTYSVIANDVEDLYTFAVQIKFLKEDFDAPVWPT